MGRKWGRGKGGKGRGGKGEGRGRGGGVKRKIKKETLIVVISLLKITWRDLVANSMFSKML